MKTLNQVFITIGLILIFSGFVSAQIMIKPEVNFDQRYVKRIVDDRGPGNDLLINIGHSFGLSAVLHDRVELGYRLCYPNLSTENTTGRVIGDSVTFKTMETSLRGKFHQIGIGFRLIQKNQLNFWLRANFGAGFNDYVRENEMGDHSENDIYRSELKSIYGDLGMEARLETNVWNGLQVNLRLVGGRYFTGDPILPEWYHGIGIGLSYQFDPSSIKFKEIFPLKVD